MMNLTPSEVVVNEQAGLPARTQHLRNSMGRFATGVAVITLGEEDWRLGGIVRSFTSVSSDPPLLLVAIDKRASFHDRLIGRPFVVNVLGAEELDVARYFSGANVLEPEWVQGCHSPRIAGVLAHFECLPWASCDAGDSTLFIGCVEDFDYRRGDALGCIAERFVVLPEYHLGTVDLG